MVAQSGPLWSQLVVQLVLTSPKISYGSVRDKLKSFRDGQGRCYSQGGAGQDKAKNLGGRAGNVSYYAGHGKLRKSVDWNPYSRGTLIWVASSSVSQICSTFIIMIITMIIILVQCCHNVMQGHNGVSRGKELPQAGRPSLQPMLTRIHYNIY